MLNARRIERWMAKAGAIGILTSAAGTAVAERSMLELGVGYVDHEREIPSLLRAPESFEQTLNRVAAESADPIRTRSLLLARIVTSNACMNPNMTPDQLAEVFRHWRDLPESVTGGPAFVNRFNVDTQTYVGAGVLGASRQSTAAQLTYSFPPDVMSWGNGGVGSTGPNDLYRSLVSAYGANDFNNADIGREFIRLGLAVWRKWCGLSYSEVTDNAASYSTATGPRPGVGDTRIGGSNVANPSFIAYNNFPNNGSDMFFDTFQFGGGSFYTNATNNFRNLRNTTTHEHGHGLSYIHQVPCDGSKIMEPAITTSIDGLGIDDLRGGHANFGDRFSGNHTSATAVNLGDITAAPAGKSLKFRFLSTNGALSPMNPAGADWFRIESSVAGRTLVVRATPVGGTFNTGPQMAVPGNICAGASSSVNASQAGTLRVELFVDPNAAPTFSNTAAAPGSGASIGLAYGTGQRFIRVSDIGPNPAANQVIQLYDLEIDITPVGSPNPTPSDPYCIAGINKIAYVGERCDFYPAVLSEATETGATLTAFQYDLDGNGTFETSGATGSTIYTTPGVRNVTIRAIDSNGKFDDDTITVTVLSYDDCDGAKQLLPGVPLASSNVGATLGSDPAHTCRPSPPENQNGVWFRFVPDVTGSYGVNTCPTSFDTVVSVFSGACGSLTPVACNDDDASHCSGNTLASNLTGLALTAGQSYYVKVSGFSGASGTFTLNLVRPTPVACCTPTGLCSITDAAVCNAISGSSFIPGAACNPNPCSVANNPCSGAVPLALNTSVLGSTLSVPNSDPDNTFPCAFGQGRGVWFTFTPAVTTRYALNSCGSDFFTLLHVFSNSNCASSTVLACNYTTNNPRGCPTGPGIPSNPFGAAARIGSVQLSAGTTYRVLLSGGSFGGGNFSAGNYALVVRCFADFNDDGTVAIGDLFDYLNTWFAGTLSADTNASGTIDVNDIFDFLNAWFTGC